MSDVVRQVLKWGADTVSSAIRNRFTSGTITTVDDVAEFVQTRAAFVSQTALFGYLKERMGISYPKHFENDEFAESIRVAQLRIYRACAADLAIYATANVAGAGELDNGKAVAFAVQIFTYALENSGREDDGDNAEAIAAFRDRAERTLWPQAARDEDAFFESPAMLVEAAPVVVEFKDSDREIVMNSIRFRWRDIREQFRKRAECIEIAEDFSVKKPGLPSD